MNPVTLREMRERFQTFRTPVVMSLFIGVFGSIVWLTYTASRQLSTSVFGIAFAPSVLTQSAGRLIFHVLLLSLLTAVLFIVPAQAAPSIVGEKERQTFKLLQVSQMSATKIVLGKVNAAVAYLALLVVTTLPLFAIPFAMGGAAVGDVMRGMLIIAVTGYAVASVSVWRSARARSTQSAVVGAYLLVGFLVVGSTAALVVEGTVVDGPQSTTVYTGVLPQDDGRELVTVWFNPYLALVDSTTDILKLQVGPGGDGAYEVLKRVLLRRQGIAFNTFRGQFGGGFEEELFFPGIDDGFVGDVVVVNDFVRGPGVGFGQGFGSGDNSIVRKRGDIWMGYVLLMVGISWIAVWATVRSVRVPTASERTLGSRRKRRARAAS